MIHHKANKSSLSARATHTIRAADLVQLTQLHAAMQTGKAVLSGPSTSAYSIARTDVANRLQFMRTEHFSGAVRVRAIPAAGLSIDQ